VNVEKAVTKTRALIEGIGASWRSIVDIARQFRKPIQDPASEAEVASEEIATARSVVQLLEAFPRLARGLGRLIVWAGFVAQFLEQMSSVVDDLQQILDEVRRLRLAVEDLDTIFLSQKNKRQRVRLDDGNVIRIRIGSLHTTEL
jgi:hypothetical protein